MKPYPALRRVAVLVACLHLAQGLLAALPSFPGAEGFGTTTPGGRGGAVVIVTTLADSGPGSFRHAVEQVRGPRTVVFEVGGVIRLHRDIEVLEPFLTVAAQTAPGEGITLANACFSIRTHDVIVRGLKARPGDSPEGTPWNSRDCIRLSSQGLTTDIYNVVIDHCSATWGLDENLSTWTWARDNVPVPEAGRIYDVTFSWNLIAEALSHRPFGSHSIGMGFLVGGNAERISVHHNLFVSNGTRNPRVAGGTRSELINNVIYNPGSEGTVLSSRTGRPIVANVIGNHYQAGPSTPPMTGSSPRALILAREREFDAASRIYLRGNIGPRRPTDTGDEWALVSADSPAFTPPSKRFAVESPAFPLSNVAITSAEEARRAVLLHAGAAPANRDRTDRRIVETLIRDRGKIVATMADLGGYPEVEGGKPPRDLDRDGLPDDWERARGLDPAIPDDPRADRDGDGYTNIEEYVNSLIPLP